MIETACLKRIRTYQKVIDAAGTFNGQPAIDYDERKSNNISAFPAAIQQLIAPGVRYDQGRRLSTQQPQMRWDVHARSSSSARELAAAIVAAMEQSGTFFEVRFGRGFEIANRPIGPETIGDLKIFRRIVDMDITATPV